MGMMERSYPRVETTKLEPAERKILEAMAKSRFQWRTAGSLAKELKMPAVTVTQILEKSERFVKARNTNSKGEHLFSTSSRYKRQTPLWRRFLNAGSNTVSG